MMSAKRAILPFLTLSALMLAACASDDNTSKPSTGTGGAPNANGETGGTSQTPPGTGGNSNTGQCTGEPVTTGGEIGNCCDKATYQSTCIDNNAKALVCQQGKVSQWECADNGCKPKTDNPLHVDCPKAAGECTLPEQKTTTNTYAANDDCPQEIGPTVKGICKADGSEGYYCKKDGDKRVVAVTKCPNNNCYLNPTPGSKCGFVECGNPNECKLPDPQTTETIYQEGADCPEALKSIKGICNKDKKEGYYCNPSTNKVKVKTCDNADCSLDPTPGSSCGFVRCGSGGSNECTEPKVTSGGKVGDCCDKETYEPSGCIDKTHGLYCKSNKAVAEWKCTAPKECNYNQATKRYECK